MTTAQKREIAMALRAEGATHREVAEMLGCSRSAAAGLADPEHPAKQAARRARYSKPCQRCGKPTDGSGGYKTQRSHCNACHCAQLYEERYWTQATIVAALPSTADAQPALAAQKGSEKRIEEAYDARSRNRLPVPPIVRREFGTGAAAMEAAGLERPPSGTPGHRVTRPTPSPEDTP